MRNLQRNETAGWFWSWWRLFELKLLTIAGCWYVAAAVLDYVTPKWFNILYCLAALAPLAAGYSAWAFGARSTQQRR